MSALISVDDAAAEFAIHRTTIFRAIRDGQLQKQRLVGDRKTYVNRWEVQRVVDPPAVTQALQLVFLSFTTTGNWPAATSLQRDLDRGPSTFDLHATLESLPPELGWKVRDSEGRVQLTLRGIARCEGSAGDVNAFLAVVRACYVRYLSDDEKPELTSSELTKTYGWGSLLREKVYKLIQVESGFWSGLGHTGDTWVLTIDLDRIRHFRNVESLSDYFAAKERLFAPFARPAIQPYGIAPVGVQRLVSPAAEDRRATHKSGGEVLAAAAAFEKAVMLRLGSSNLYGRRLVDAFFDLAQQGAPPNPSRLEALRQVALGVMAAFRNPAAHGRMEFGHHQIMDISAVFRLLTAEVEAIPLPKVVALEVRRKGS